MNTSAKNTAKATQQKTYHESWWVNWYVNPPKNTREKILFSAFCEVHLNGFQAASIQNIINSAGVTKGALYHYFSSKDEIGLALLDEVYSEYMETNYIQPLIKTDDPITSLLQRLGEVRDQLTEEDVALGCPLDHFSQEMSSINPEYQKRIDALYQRKHDILVAALKRGQLVGTVTRNISAESAALMINASIQGCISMAKNARSLQIICQFGVGLFHYLERLRPHNCTQN